MNLLLDTNVWIDYYVGSRPGHSGAYDLVSSALEFGHTLCYAVNTSRDVFFNVVHGIKRKYREETGGELTDAQANAATVLGWSCLEHMAECATAVGCDASDVWLARKHRCVHSDYEDNLIIASAQRSGVDFLVTGDKALLLHCPVPAMDASHMARYLKEL